MRCKTVSWLPGPSRTVLALVEVAAYPPGPVGSQVYGGSAAANHREWVECALTKTDYSRDRAGRASLERKYLFRR